jgi:hypothetical protein
MSDFPIPTPPALPSSWGQQIVNEIKALGRQLAEESQTEVTLLEAIIDNQVAQLQQDAQVLANQATQISQLTSLIALLTPPKPGPAVAFTIKVTSQGDIMAKGAKKFGKLKVSLNPDGTATATIIGIVDAFENPTTFEAGTVPTWVCEVTVGAGADPNVTLTPAADGMSCGVAAGTTLVAGDTLTCTAAQPTLGTLSESYSPVSVVAGPANSFVISVQ